MTSHRDVFVLCAHATGFDGDDRVRLDGLLDSGRVRGLLKLRLAQVAGDGDDDTRVGRLLRLALVTHSQADLRGHIGG